MTCVHQKIEIRMFMEALPITAPNWKNTQMLTNRGVDKLSTTTQNDILLRNKIENSY